MSELADIIIELEEDQILLPDNRVIGVSLNSRINFNSFSLNEQFSFPSEAISNVAVESAGKRGVVVSLLRDVAMNTPDAEVFVSYSASSESGEQVSGRILFPDIEFEIGVAPIIYELDSCCSLPDKIVIRVRDYNNGLPIEVTSLGSNDSNAGTVVLTEIEGSDYNDDYNDDFGMEPNQLITYTLNKTTDFWKTLNAVDTFQYNVSYKGKTASNFITVKLK